MFYKSPAELAHILGQFRKIQARATNLENPHGCTEARLEMAAFAIEHIPSLIEEYNYLGELHRQADQNYWQLRRDVDKAVAFLQRRECEVVFSPSPGAPDFENDDKDDPVTHCEGWSVKDIKTGILISMSAPLCEVLARIYDAVLNAKNGGDVLSITKEHKG